MNYEECNKGLHTAIVESGIQLLVMPTTQNEPNRLEVLHSVFVLDQVDVDSAFRKVLLPDGTIRLVFRKYITDFYWKPV
jgi:hypothetical protein